jgi:hypothetical protein
MKKIARIIAEKVPILGDRVVINSNIQDDPNPLDPKLIGSAGTITYIPDTITGSYDYNIATENDGSSHRDTVTVVTSDTNNTPFTGRLINHPQFGIGFKAVLLGYRIDNGRESIHITSKEALIDSIKKAEVK